MIARYWLRSLLRVAPGRTVATAAGVALAVAFAATLAIFVISASYTMTARAIANVPVDWQVELAPGVDPATVEAALEQAGVARSMRRVEYAKVDGFAANTGDTQQVTGPGQAIGIAPDYLAAFPNQVTLLSGSFDGPVLYSQTAANLHAGVGDEISINRPGLAPASVRVAGVAAIPNIDSLFQAVGAPSGLAPQSPPDNILILPDATWRSIFDPQRAAKPETARTQLHVLLDRARLPADPVTAYQAARQMAGNLEARIAGSAAIANNLAARLDGVRGDALYAKVLFLFLGAPGVVLAALVTASIAGAGRARRMREQALLRIRGATLAETLLNPAVEAAVIGIAGAVAGLLLAFVALSLMGVSVGAPTALGWGLFAAAAGLAFAVAAIVVPAAQDARILTVAQSRSLVEKTRRRPLWERLWLDLGLLAAAGLIFWSVQGAGYQIVLASEGVAQTSVNYASFLAPLALWAGLGLLWVRLSRGALIAARTIRNPLLHLTAGDLAPTVAASLSRQASRIARGAGLLALAVGFALSTAAFNVTYSEQARVDAELSNGADVNVTGATANPAGAALQAILKRPGVLAAVPMMHRYAYVGADLQDLYGIDPGSIGHAVTMANAYFVNGDAKATLAKLGATPDGVLVSEETVNDFQLHQGDAINLRLQSVADHQYHVVPFTFVGIVREFPTAPKDSFLVANAAYVARASVSEAREVVLVRASDPAATARDLKSVLASNPALKVTALGEVRSLISSSLTAVSLSALTKVELVFGLVLIGAAAGLVVGLGFAERHRTFAILTALGASASQLGAFLRSEAALVAIAGLTFGIATGLAIAWMLVSLLAGVFDPPPETLIFPFGYLAIVMAGVAIVAATVVIAFQRAHARADAAALRLE
jgi:putative ABC transport system permease protein